MRPQNSKLYLPRLDQLRFVAAAMVVFSHAWDCFYRNMPVDGLFQLRFRSGDAGVALFFVLSGFIFTHLAEVSRADSIDYRKFIYNRAVRIFPLLIFMLAISFAAQRSHMTPIDMLYPLMLMMNSGAALKDGYPMLWSITWTIAVEFQFYLIFPFLYKFAKAKPVYLVGLIALLVALRTSAFFASADYASQMSYLTLPYRIDQFAFGMLLGFSYNRHLFSSKLRPLLWIASAGAVVAIAELYSYQHTLQTEFGAHVWFSTVEGVLWMAIIAGALSTNILTKGFVGRSLAQLGAASYSLYLVHLFVILPIANQIKPLVDWQYLVRDPRVNFAYGIVIGVMLPLAVLLSWFTFKLVEQPFFQFRTSYFRRNEDGAHLRSIKRNERVPTGTGR
ncbi:acyltransferase family protein [Burkholderia multivorans]|uniref:acyltransferase family protein n=1 Tax=Burkholderia multivorans TaxID=87883 RepID=UPI00018E3B49|nr:acyltransferase [Burkholderia multivorans]EED98584.1 acyltransferase 3 [Burkholderia multivorans CGD1]